MKKLLFYSDCFVFGGSENVIVNLLHCRELREHFDVTFAYRTHKLYERGVQTRLAGVEGLRPLHIASNETLFYRLEQSWLPKPLRYLVMAPFAVMRRLGLYFLWNVAHLMFFFREQKPDVLHINNGGYPGASSCRQAALAARIARVPRIIFMVNSMAYPPRNDWHRWWDKKVQASVTRFLTASRAAAEQLSKVRGFPRERIDSIPNTVREFTRSRSRSQVRAELGLEDSHFVLIAVGMLTEGKGQALLLSALASLARPDLRVLFLGEGEDREMLEAMAKRLGVQSQVIFLGHRTDPMNYVEAADVLVHPSYREDMPYVVLEALAIGKPVIATRVGGIPEEIRDGVDGLLIEPGRDDELAAAIAKLHGDRELARTLGANGAQRFQSEFAYEPVCRRFIALYLSAASL